jgi:RimJ/RimL family protein N-acetyltransferase
MGDAFTIGLLRAGDEFAAYDFHVRTAGEYLWPRPADEFVSLLQQRQLFGVKANGQVVGLCYLKPDAGRWEFGGIYLEPRFRGHGLAAALGRVAIGTAYLFYFDASSELIAHVHEFNAAPRNLLTRQLGFRATGETEIPPPDVAPSNMRRNDAGQVVGDLFRHTRSSLDEFATWLEQFDGLSHGKTQPAAKLALQADVWRYRDRYIPALRRTARLSD